MSCIIYLQGKNSHIYTEIDDEDYNLLSKFKWYLTSKGYVSKYNRIGKKMKAVSMHRFLLGLTELDKVVVDHINRNPLDNRKLNLRICTQDQNNKNSYTHGNKKFKSQFKGVSKSRNKDLSWAVRIVVNKKNIYIGTFHDEKIAALAYDQAARKYHGEFACLNFPEINEYSDIIPSIRSPHKSSPYEGIVARKLTKGKIGWMVFYKKKYIKIFRDLEEAYLFRTAYIKEQNNVN